MKVIDKIKLKIDECKGEGIRPALVILSRKDERSLFTGDDNELAEHTIPKNLSAETYLMDNFEIELLVTDKQTDPDVLGRYKLEL